MVLHIVLGLVLEMRTEAAAPGTLLTLSLAADYIFVEMLRTYKQ
jgi:hypothetical protein